MKVIILAGGLQSSIHDDIEGIPKPMAEIGGKPILWHIMKNFSQRGFREFIVCGGYKVNLIKEYFKDFYIFQSDITVDLKSNQITIHKKRTEDWEVTVLDTGLSSSPGARILQVKDYVGQDPFIVTYGDCLSDLDYLALFKQYEVNHKLAVISVARPAGRNALLPMEKDGTLMEESKAGLPENMGFVNAGCWMFDSRIFPYLEEHTNMEQPLLDHLAKDGQITTYRHHGFWTLIETNREKVNAEEVWKNGKAPWKVWEA